MTLVGLPQCHFEQEDLTVWIRWDVNWETEILVCIWTPLRVCISAVRITASQSVTPLWQHCDHSIICNKQEDMNVISPAADVVISDFMSHTDSFHNLLSFYVSYLFLYFFPPPFLQQRSRHFSVLTWLNILPSVVMVMTRNMNSGGGGWGRWGGETSCQNYEL